MHPLNDFARTRLQEMLSRQIPFVTGVHLVECYEGEGADRRLIRQQVTLEVTYEADPKPGPSPELDSGN